MPLLTLVSWISLFCLLFYITLMLMSSKHYLIYSEWFFWMQIQQICRTILFLETDRNNMVEMKEPSVNYPLTSEKPLTMFTNAEIVWSSDPETKTKHDLVLSMASSGYYNSLTLCKVSPDKEILQNELNNAPASYRGMLLRFATGSYYYMCTRNNNFSNRNQKGRLVVHDVPGSKLIRKWKKLT